MGKTYNIGTLRLRGTLPTPPSNLVASAVGETEISGTYTPSAVPGVPHYLSYGPANGVQTVVQVSGGAFDLTGLSSASVYTIGPLWAENGWGASTVVGPITVVTPTPPDASFTVDSLGGPVTVSGYTVTFMDTSLHNPTLISWDFGDGNTGTGSPVVHTYLTNGVYDTVMTAENDAGSDTAQVTITVTPVAGFSLDVNVGYAPLTVNLTGADVGTITSRSTDWGDGSSPSTSNSPSHTYTVAGSYTITRTVVGPDGDQGSFQVVAAVEVADPFTTGTLDYDGDTLDYDGDVLSYV